jgi:hypothetical protein
LSISTLVHAGLADVAVPAEHLQAVGGRAKAVVRHERLHDRRHQRHHLGAELAVFFRGAVELLVGHQRDPVGKRAAGLGVGARGQQHLAHVRVVDDRIGLRVRALHA